MKKLKKILNMLFVGLMILIIMINVYVLYIRFIKHENIVKIYGYSALIIISGSMEPSIKVNDLIIIKEENDYNDGDIITYKDENVLITHRIIEKAEGSIITKGDNNNVADKAITKEAIQGKMVYKIDNFGFIIEIINSPIGIVTIIAILFFLIRKMYNTKESR